MKFNDRVAIGQLLTKVNDTDLFHKDREKLVSLTSEATEKVMTSAIEQGQSSWLVDFLVNGGEKTIDPNKDIMVVI